MIGKSIEQLKNNFVGLIGISGGIFGLSMILSIVSIFIDPTLVLIASLLYNLLIFFVSIVIVKYIIRVVSTRGKVSFKDVTSNMFGDVLKMLCLYFIFGVIMIIPIIIMFVCIFGSIFMALMEEAGIIMLVLSVIGCMIFMYIFMFIMVMFVAFIQYAVFDESLGDLSFGKRFSLGLKLTKGYKLKILGAYILGGLVNIAGVCCFFVGIFVTIPLAQLFIANLYAEARDRYLYGNVNSSNSYDVDNNYNKNPNDYDTYSTYNGNINLNK